MNRRCVAAGALAGLCSAALVATQGCGVFAPLRHPKRDLVDCYAKALEPVAGEVFDTAELAKDLTTGKASLDALLVNLQATDAEVQTLLSALHACAAPPPAPSPVAVTGS